MTDSHAAFLATYAEAFPAEITPTVYRDRNVIGYRIAGPKASVLAAIDNIGQLLAKFPEDIKWRAIFWTNKWPFEWVAHGEVYVPETATNFWRMVG